MGIKKRLLEAAKENKVIKLLKLVNLCNDLMDAKDDEGATIFHWAAHHGNIELIEELYENYNVYLDPSDYRGESPLHWAVKNNQVEAIKFLNNYNIDFNHRDLHGYTPLHHAVSGKCANYNTVNALLQCDGIDINSTIFISRQTPLYLAAYNNHADIVKLLLDHKADPTIERSGGDTPLSLAVKNDNSKIIRLLQENIKSIGSQSSNFETSDDQTILSLLSEPADNMDTDDVSTTEELSCSGDNSE